jgi:hypothetical protein
LLVVIAMFGICILLVYTSTITLEPMN